MIGHYLQGKQGIPLVSFPWEVKATQSCPTLCDPKDYTVHGILQARILEWVAFPFSRGSSQPRDQTQVSHIAGRFFTSWATGKPKNTGVGSLSLLQGVFPTQESNWGLQHCRQINWATREAWCFFLEIAVNSSLSSVDLQGHTATRREHKYITEF